MSRRAVRLLLAAVVAALVVPVAAGASLNLRGIDTSGYPTVRVTVVAPVAAAAAPPTLTENGNAVVGLRATNLASTKSVVVAIDRSRSMAGAKLADALDAARAFLHTKSPSDRVAVVAFGSKAVQLTPFSQSTAEADDALRLLKVDPASGRVEATIEIGGSGIDIAARGDQLWVPTRSEAVDPSGFPTMDALKRVSVSTRTVSTVTQPTSRLDVHGLVAAKGAVWIADNRRGYLYRVPTS